MAVPECPTTHMYDYPDFGRATIDGLWAAQSPARSARTALLVDPQFVMEAYRLGVAQCKRLAENSPHEDVRANAKGYDQFLLDDFEVFPAKHREAGTPINVRDLSQVIRVRGAGYLRR